MKNTIVKSGIAGTFIALSFLGVSFAGAEEKDAKNVGTSQEIHISDNGKVLARGAKVTAVSGSSITATDTWGGTIITWTIVTDSKTQFVRRFGGQSSLAETSVNDIVSFNGTLSTGSAPFTVNASTVKNWSVQKQRSTVSGSVLSVSTASFVLQTENRGDVTVNVTSSTSLMKGSVRIALSDIKVGDKVNAATGILDTVNKTLQAEKVVVKDAKTPEAKRTFEGKLKTIGGVSIPSTLTVTVGNTEYTVNIAAGTSVLSNNWLATSLDKFKTGDKIRFYGATRAESSTTVDATIVRNTSI